MAKMVDEYERTVPNTITVTLKHAPRYWLSSLHEVTDLPVRYVVSDGYRWLTVDLATPLFPLPEAILRPESVNKGRAARSDFRKALREAVAAQLECEVAAVANSVVDWGDGLPPAGVGGR